MPSIVTASWSISWTADSTWTGFEKSKRRMVSASSANSRTGLATERATISVIGIAASSRMRVMPIERLRCWIATDINSASGIAMTR